LAWDRDPHLEQNGALVNQGKSVVDLAGARHDAAHGHFDKISKPSAQVFLDRVHLLIEALTSATKLG
jgi:hypothetical protein